MKAPSVLLPFITLLAAAFTPSAVGQSRFNTIYSFTDGYPVAMGRVNGVFYGAYQSSGTCGSIFSLQPSAGAPPADQWNETVL